MKTDIKVKLTSTNLTQDFFVRPQREVENHPRAIAYLTFLWLVTTVCCYFFLVVMR